MFEVIFSIAILSLILIGVVSLTTKTVANENFSKNNALATKFAQEAMEWIREERDSDWSNLASRTPATNINLGSLNWSSANPILGTALSRSVNLTFQTVVDSNDTIRVEVIVSWTDGQGSHQVVSVTDFTNWNR